jgi:hypothetical protein
MPRKDSPFPAKVDFAAPVPPITGGVPYFTATEGVYHMLLAPPGITFHLDRVRRDHHELIGELAVHTDLAGSRRSMSGALLTADFNLSSARARQERAKILAERARSADSIDWLRHLEEFCERVHEAERRGAPAIFLPDVPYPTADLELRAGGFTLLRQHPMMLFGDGGAAKSYLALYFAGLLTQQGLSVVYADWEQTKDEHRVRIERLFPDAMPRVIYVHCQRALVHEVDRLRQVIQEHHVDYVVFDSVAFACDGPPEAAEIAGSYFRALRQLNVGSLHLAHITKGSPDQRPGVNEQRPFGSAFWHNGARSTWFIKRTDANDDPTQFSVGLFQRKANMGPLHHALGYQISFVGDTTAISHIDIRENSELAATLPLFHRIIGLLKQGAMTTVALADELGAKEDTVRKLVTRKRDFFVAVQIPGNVQQFGLKQR